MINFTNTDNTIDIRDIIARFEELEAELEGIDSETLSQVDAENQAELLKLKELLDDCKGMGGDEEWRGDWYPITLIHEDYFEEAMDEMIADCYELPKDLPFWMKITYDYNALKMDYTHVSYDGETYLVR